jgi:hypothetical protein
MKYSPHPDADKRAAQMVWRGRGRNTVEAFRREPETVVDNPRRRTQPPAPIPDTEEALKPSK